MPYDSSSTEEAVLREWVLLLNKLEQLKPRQEGNQDSH